MHDLIKLTSKNWLTPEINQLPGLNPGSSSAEVLKLNLDTLKSRQGGDFLVE